MINVYVRALAPRVPTIHGDTKSLIFTADFKIFPVIVGSNVTAYGKCLLKIVCHASGDPRPFIVWSKSGGKIERKFIRGENLLLPRNVASSGRYICKAVNAFGFAELTSDIRFVGWFFYHAERRDSFFTRITDRLIYLFRTHSSKYFGFERN